MNSKILSDALLELGGNGFSCEDSLDKIFWHNGNTKKLTNEKIQAKYDELIEADKKLQYQRDRIYPSIGEQLDLQYWDKKNGTKKWEEAIDKVKADHPKG